MSRNALICLAVIAMAWPAMAQGRRDRGGDFGPGRQEFGGGFGRGSGEQDDWRGRGGPRGGRMSLDRMADRLAERLELSEDQRAQYDEIVADYADHWQQQQGHREERRELAMAYRDARDNGNLEEAEEIRARMREVGGGRREMMQSFFTDVEQILEPAQVERLSEIRQHIGRGQRGPRRGDMRQLVQEMPERLSMTEDQRVAFDEILAQARERRQANRERWQEIAPLVREMRDARRNGDEARADELRAELEELRPERPQPGHILEQIRGILTADQQQMLEEIQREFVGSGRGRDRGQRAPQMDLRAVMQAAKRVNVEGAQRSALKQAITEATREARRNRNPESQAAIAAELHQQILTILAPEQETEYTKALADVEHRGRRGHGDQERDRHQRRGARPGPAGGDRWDEPE